MKVVGCQPYAPAAFTPQEIFLAFVSVRRWIDRKDYVNQKFQWHHRESNTRPAALQHNAYWRGQYKINRFLFIKCLRRYLFLWLESPQWATASSLSMLHNHTRFDTPHSVGLLCTKDWLDAETSTWQHTTLTGDRYPWPWQESNPQSQQASGRKPTP
jgi:hypothetical protein